MPWFWTANFKMTTLFLLLILFSRSFWTTEAAFLSLDREKLKGRRTFVGISCVGRELPVIEWPVSFKEYQELVSKEDCCLKPILGGLEGIYKGLTTLFTVKGLSREYRLAMVMETDCMLSEICRQAGISVASQACLLPITPEESLTPELRSWTVLQIETSHFMPLQRPSLEQPGHCPTRATSVDFGQFPDLPVELQNLIMQCALQCGCTHFTLVRAICKRFASSFELTCLLMRLPKTASAEILRSQFAPINVFSKRQVVEQKGVFTNLSADQKVHVIVSCSHLYADVDLRIAYANLSLLGVSGVLAEALIDGLIITERADDQFFTGMYRRFSTLVTASKDFHNAGVDPGPFFYYYRLMIQRYVGRFLQSSPPPPTNEEPCDWAAYCAIHLKM